MLLGLSHSIVGLECKVASIDLGHGPGATEPSEAESGCDAFFAVSKAFTLLGTYMSNVQNPYDIPLH